MANEKTIDVTPNVEKCLEILKDAVESLPEGDLKKRAEGALDYLDSTAKGEPQPLGGRSCPADKAIIAQP